MGTDARAVEWYRNCIHERQRRANTLSIEVELNAKDKDDPGALADAMDCLDSAIRNLEQANQGLVLRDDQPATARRRKRPIPEVSPEPLMEDLGHSMEWPDMTPLRPRAPRRSKARNGARSPRHAVDFRRIDFESSLYFFQ